MNANKISIIVPIYNGERYVEQLIEAIKKQTYKHIEVILVDDGSKDKTLESCYKFVGNDDRFVIYSKKNGGASSARNYGLEKASGEYIAFIDADDYIFPDYIQYLYDLIQKYSADASCCGYFKMWDTEKMPTFSNSSNEMVFDREEALENLLYRKFITGSPCLKIYKKEILKRLAFPTEIIYGEDTIFTLEAIKLCDRIVYGDRVLYIYYQHSSSATHNNKTDQYKLAWDLHYTEIIGYARRENISLLNAAQAKCFILAIDYSCRIWKDKKNNNFKRELLSYIKSVDRAVLKDKKCKKINRILAGISCCSPILMIELCRFYTWLKAILRFETRQSV